MLLDAAEQGSAGRIPDSVTITPEYGLYDHQREVVDKAMDILARYRQKGVYPERRVIAHLPTGAGKTRIACHVGSRLLHESDGNDGVVVWLAATEELCEQAASELSRAWTKVGAYPVQMHRYWGDSTLDLRRLAGGFLVASTGKLWSATRRDWSLLADLSRGCAGVVFDEAHQAVAPTYEFMTEQLLTYEPPLLGLTATPGRSSEVGDPDHRLAELFRYQKVDIDPRGHPNPVAYLINSQFLAQPTFINVDFDSDVMEVQPDPEEGMDYSPAVLRALGRDYRRTLQLADVVGEAMDRHARVMVFCPSVESARDCNDLLAERGRSTRVVTAETPAYERQEAMASYRSDTAEPMALVNYGVYTAGVDAPRTRCVVIGRATTSLVLYSQMMGRGVRGPRMGGNRWCEIYTVVDRQLPGFGSVAEAFMNWEAMWSKEA